MTGPSLFYGAKRRNFTLVPMVTFSFVTLNLIDLPMEIGEIVTGYMSHKWFSLTHILILGGLSSIFYKGHKTAILGNVFSKISN